jgi:hypothetical protein
VKYSAVRRKKSILFSEKKISMTTVELENCPIWLYKMTALMMVIHDMPDDCKGDDGGAVEYKRVFILHID